MSVVDNKRRVYIDPATGNELEYLVEGDASGSVTIGKTTTVPPGTTATVTNVGTASDLVLEIEIPRGETGDIGETGPTGGKGETGDTGDQGAPGEGGTPLYYHNIQMTYKGSYVDSAVVDVTIMNSSGTPIATKTAAGRSAIYNAFVSGQGVIHTGGYCYYGNNDYRYFCSGYSLTPAGIAFIFVIVGWTPSYAALAITIGNASQLNNEWTLGTDTVTPV